MQASETTLRFALVSDYMSACHSGIVMKYVEMELTKLAIKQSQDILIEIDSAINSLKNSKN